MPIRKSKREATIVGQVLDYLKTRDDCFCWRSNTGGYYQGSRYISYGYPGSPDIIGVWAGKFLGIECKTERGKQFADQLRFVREFTQRGGVYILARDWRDVQKAMDS